MYLGYLVAISSIAAISASVVLAILEISGATSLMVERLKRHELQLLSPVDDVSGIPTAGRHLIVVAAVKGVLHFRVFDGAGRMVEDTRENRLAAEAGPLENLRMQLESDRPPRKLTVGEECRVIAILESLLFKDLTNHRPVFWAGLIFWAVFALVSIGCLVSLRGSTPVPAQRLDFERITNVPNGVSPFFPILFLAGAAVSWIHLQLERRRVYRLSYLPALSPGDVVQDESSQPERWLYQMRVTRQDVDLLIAKPYLSASRIHYLLPWVPLILLTLMFIRVGTRGIPRSLEGYRFDLVFWSLFVLVILGVVVHTFQLLALWNKIRAMLGVAIMLPMAHAFDRLPRRFKGWFFGAEEFGARKELVLQQNAALLGRSTPELAGILQATFPAALRDWDAGMDRLRRALSEDREGAIDSTRTVYPLLDPIWDSSPVEDLVQRRTGSTEKPEGAPSAASWPLTPQARHRLNDDDKLEMLRDWTRAAEDLVALQIVHWFGPAASQLLPIMRFLVLGPLLLLLAVTSYPFDHSGWLMIVMVTLLLFVAGAIGIVMIGTNRDELISRVSDTTPGRLSFDGGFVTSLLTMIGPLIGALLAISYDLSDLLRVWFGPIFQLF